MLYTSLLAKSNHILPSTQISESAYCTLDVIGTEPFLVGVGAVHCLAGRSYRVEFLSGLAWRPNNVGYTNPFPICIVT